MQKIMKWRSKNFNDLSPFDLYSIMVLRQKVFIIEQECLYQDLDNCDQNSLHLRGLIDMQLATYARIVPPGTKYREAASIGRVVVDPMFRKAGLGKKLMHQAIQVVRRKYGAVPIHISAQAHLANKFYESLGFEAIGNVYQEDGIPHVGMDRNPRRLGAELVRNDRSGI
jgi:ElaA protein